MVLDPINCRIPNSHFAPHLNCTNRLGTCTGPSATHDYIYRGLPERTVSSDGIGTVSPYTGEAHTIIGLYSSVRERSACARVARNALFTSNCTPHLHITLRLPRKIFLTPVSLNRQVLHCPTRIQSNIEKTSFPDRTAKILYRSCTQLSQELKTRFS